MMKHPSIRVLVLAVVCLSLFTVSPASAEVYFAGEIAGTFYYDNGNSGDFTGVLYQQGSRIWGDCVDEEGESSLTGTVSGNSITFIKTYRNRAVKVQYSGDLIPETNTVKGYWRIDQNNIGKFTMTVRGNKM